MRHSGNRHLEGRDDLSHSSVQISMNVTGPFNIERWMDRNLVAEIGPPREDWHDRSKGISGDTHSSRRQGSRRPEQRDLNPVLEKIAVDGKDGALPVPHCLNRGTHAGRRCFH
jgi:hypothetical protein